MFLRWQFCPPGHSPWMAVGVSALKAAFPPRSLSPHQPWLAITHVAQQLPNIRCWTPVNTARLNSGQQVKRDFPINNLGHTYIKKQFVIHLKFKFNWAFSISLFAKSGNLTCDRCCVTGVRSQATSPSQLCAESNHHWSDFTS